MSLLTENRSNASVQLGAIFEAFPDLLLDLDNQGRVVDYKAGDFTLLHLSPEGFLNRRLEDFLPTNIGQEFQRALEQASLTQKSASLACSLNFPEGLRWFETRLIPFSQFRVIAIMRDVTKYKQAEEKIQRQLKHLSALRAIDTLISSSFDLNLTLSILLSHVTARLNVDAAAILLFNRESRFFEYTTGVGFRTEALRDTRLRLGEGYAGLAALQRKTIHIPNLQHRKTDYLRSPVFYQESFISYFGIPLIAKGQVCGVLEIFHRTALDPDPDWLDFMETLAGQAAIAIENATLFRELQRSNIELTQAYDATIDGWSRALELRDRETEGHTQRVTSGTVQLARQMNFSEEELVHVRRGAILHDIGKMAIPDTILFKATALTDSEREIIQQHPRYAYDMLSPIPYLRPALDIPLYHHEKWDGSGYPHGLKQDQIPLSARLFSVVDVFDAVTSDRPYRPPWSRAEALDYIRDQSGKSFDPNVVGEFMNTVDAWQIPDGSSS
ncbi:MAG TPA: HD domain-containing phosphohydrolase [Anaerolineales bacterium]|nr:HD domain-containing phosphohydrolase [Anaerolineales bacterium]